MFQTAIVYTSALNKWQSLKILDQVHVSMVILLYVCVYAHMCMYVRGYVCVCVCNMKFEASADRNFYWLDLLFASVTSPCLNTVFNQLFYDLQRMLQLNYDAALILRCSSKKKKM